MVLEHDQTGAVDEQRPKRLVSSFQCSSGQLYATFQMPHFIGVHSPQSMFGSPATFDL
jgi:hypothetical protein